MNRAFCLSFLLLLGFGLDSLNGADFASDLAARHGKDLVELKGQDLAPVDAHRFSQARFTIIYFGAGWCPDCRRFSPTLVEAYDRQSRGAKNFEVLLVSRDQDAGGMLKFMKIEHMRWPALAFDKIASAEDLTRFDSGHGIPCLTVIDREGKVVLQSKDDQDARLVLQQLQEKISAELKK